MTGEHIPQTNGEYTSEDNELMDALENIWDIALENKLDPYPTHFEVAPANIVYQVGSYGIPGRHSHWTFGREYKQMITQYNFGMSKIYELVINSNPSLAFLLENNPPIANKFVMAHVLGHTDFFKNNMMFAGTRRDMPQAVAHNADRIRSYEDEAGVMNVEKLLDSLMALEQHVDPYNIDRPQRADEIRTWQQEIDRQEQNDKRPAGEFDDLFTPRAATVERNLGRRALTIPPKPDADILGFIRNHAPYLEEWERDVVDIVRSESLYFYPQRRTTIMNEGWAAYWHKRIMREMENRDQITGAESEEWWKLHSGVVQPNPRSLNRYYLGMMIYEYIEDYYNGTLTDKETAYLEKEGIETFPRYDGALADSPAMPYLRDAMMYNDDQSFIRQYFNKIIAERTELYMYDEVPDGVGGTKVVVVENGWEMIRDQIVASMDNNGQPLITVVNGDHNSAGELLLRHEFDGRMLDPPYIEKTLPYVHSLWRRPVNLETIDDKNRSVTYCYDGVAMTKGYS